MKRSLLKKLILSALAFSISLTFGPLAAIAGEKVLGYWKTIDDKTKTKKSVVKIYKKADGKYYGRIIRLFRKPNEDQHPRCTKCKGDKKNKPTIGMEIMWGMTKHEWKKGRYTYKGGRILDPANGKEYSCEIWPSADGKKLKVKGCIFWPLCRTQTWYKTTKPVLPKAPKKAVKKAPAPKKTK